MKLLRKVLVGVCVDSVAVMLPCHKNMNQASQASMC